MNSAVPWIFFILIWLVLMAILNVMLKSGDSYLSFVFTGISVGVVVGVVMYLLAKNSN